MLQEERRQDYQVRVNAVPLVRRSGRSRLAVAWESEAVLLKAVQKPQEPQTALWTDLQAMRSAVHRF